MRIKENGSEVLIYNGINNYILQAILKNCCPMLYDLLQTKHIYIVCGKTDLRKIDGLASLIQQSINSSFTKMPFLFCGNRQDRFKLLYWDGDGFLLCYKRIENGKLKWPRTRRSSNLNEPTGSMVVRRIKYRSTSSYFARKKGVFKLGVNTKMC